MYVLQNKLAFFGSVLYNDFDNCIMRERKRKGDNMKRVKSVYLLLFALTLILVLGSCRGEKEEGKESTLKNQSSQETNAEPTIGGSIVVGISQDLDSLDPHKSVAAGTKEVLFNVYEGLVKPDSSGNYIDAVAKSHTISEDGKTYTFQLREGVKFHNGAEVTAEDVKYSIERCAGITEGGTPLISAFSIVDRVEIPDEHTVEIHLKKADTEFLAYLIVGIVPKDVKDYNKNPVGTGPFMYDSRSPLDYVKLKKFDDYWDQEHKAYLDEVTFKIVADNSALVNGLKGGFIQMAARISPNETADLDKEKFTIYEGGSNLVQALYLNNAVKPFDDIRVRQALCYAVDRQAIIDIASNGKGTVIGSSMFPAFKKYYMPELSTYYKQDIQKAKALLKEAGYPNGFDMTITAPSNYQKHVDVAQVLVEQLKQIGVRAKIELVEWDSWLNDVYANREYQSTVVGVDAAYLSARALLERFTSEYSRNFINYSNPKYDALYEKANHSISDEEQIKYYKEMQTLLTKDAANVYIQDLKDQVALDSRYGGYEFYPLYVQDMAKIYKVTQ